MHFNERFLNRLAQDRTRELAREASLLRQSRAARTGWRTRAAHSLVALAERLEPSAPAHRRHLAGH